MIKVTFEGYNEKREKMQLVKIGDLVKETEKQIVVQEPLGSTCTINKSKIIERIDDYVLPEAELVEVVDEPINMKELLPHVQNYYKYIDKIQRCEESILESFFDIGRYLQLINENSLYKLENYKDIYEFAEDKFKYKKTSVVNMIAVYTKYQDSKDPTSIAEDYATYSYTALVELLPVPEEEIKKNYTPEDSIVDIRKSKKLSKLDSHIKDIVKKFDFIYKKVCNIINENNKEIKNKRGIITCNSGIKRTDIENFYYYNTFGCSDYKSPFNYCSFKIDLEFEDLMFNGQRFSFNDPGFETKILNYARDLLDNHNELFVEMDKKEKVVKEVPTFVSMYYSTAIKEYHLQSIYEFLLNYFKCMSYYVDVYKKDSILLGYKIKAGSIVGKIEISGKLERYLVIDNSKDDDVIVLLNIDDGLISGHLDRCEWDFTDRFFKNDFIEFLIRIQEIVNHTTKVEEDEEEPEDYGDVDE